MLDFSTFGAYALSEQFEPFEKFKISTIRENLLGSDTGSLARPVNQSGTTVESGKGKGMIVSERIREYKQNVSATTSHPILDGISIDAVEYFEMSEKLTPVYAEKLGKIRALLEKNPGLTIDETWKSIFNEYCEATAFRHCNAKIYIERVVETKEKRPDYKMIFRGKEYYLEVKSLFYLNATANYKKNQLEGLAARLDIEEQLASGATVAMSSQSFQPYNDGSSRYLPNSKIAIIEGIINKVRQNFKSEQYDLGDSLLYIDLRGLGISTKAFQAIKPTYIENYDGKNTICSGELWNAVFAELNELIFFHPKGSPPGNIEGRLGLAGIMVDFPKLRGVVFQIESMHENKTTLVGLCREEDYEAKELLKSFCDHVNDSKNNEAIFLRESIL